MKVKRQKEDKSKYDKFKVSGTLGRMIKKKKEEEEKKLGIKELVDN